MNINQSNIDTGKLLTLISADIVNIGDQIWCYLFMLSLPISITVPLIFMFIDLGLSTFVALIIVLLIISQVFFSAKMSQAIKRYLGSNDIRNKITNETIQGIRIVKYSGLERVFIDRIEKIRYVQCWDSFWITFYSQIVAIITRSIEPVINSMLIPTFVLTNDIPQSEFPVKMIPNLNFMSQLTKESRLIPMLIQGIMMVYVALQRIQEFLLLPELQQEIHEKPNDSDKIALTIEKGYFAWSEPIQFSVSEVEKEINQKEMEQQMKHLNNEKDICKDDSKQNIEEQIDDQQSNYLTENENNKLNEMKKQVQLQNININLPKGSLTMVIGSVGSGKSSLGAAVIGDIERQSGEVKHDGQIAYCPQTPWINNNTIRGNITFGSEYEEKKYNEIVHVCALEPDFKILPAGDITAIGEKGVNLSGGQKARIQLARAVYSDRDIYILDDPLSAVDAHVGSRRITAQGQYSELIKLGIDFQQYAIKDINKDEDKQDQKTEKLAENEDHVQTDQIQQQNKEIKESNEETVQQTGKQIHTEEEYETGAVPWIQYWEFFCTLLLAIFRIPYILLLLSIEAVQTLLNYWLGIVGSDTIIPQLSYHWKIIIYAVIYGGLFLLLLLNSFISGFNQKRSNSITHSKLLQSIIQAPCFFFDTTPVGRILNRLTGDLTLVDMMLNNNLLSVVGLILGFAGQIIIISINSPMFLAIGIPAIIVHYTVNKLYSRASRNFKRMESISKSPIVSLYGETLTGLSSIRAFKLEDVWREKFYRLNDEYGIRSVLWQEGKLWASVYASFASAFIMLGVVLLGWYYMTPAVLSISITAAFTIAYLGTVIVHQSVDLESYMTNFGRILLYTNRLPQEIQSSDVPVKLKKNWPSKGRIQFDNVTFRYRSGLPFVLKDVNFTFKGGEKIGVCGRTGAGKSSLMFPLFRLIELDPKLQPTMIDMKTGLQIESDPNEEPNKGKILIDRKDISQIDISRVRRSIAIIPQDPTLFTGTLRYNLDIAGKCNDDRIWEVLGMVQMRDIIAGLPLGLDTQVAEGGSNFSTGQRQLICFGRAILNNCRIVIMDEATASVDVQTDAKIHKTIKEQFVDKTVVIIAHRLNTIMNSDRIMVMADGRVAEIGKPKKLLQNKSSAFSMLVNNLTNL
ncbi:MAG: putative Multidrug resistance-associated protein [Streblomastix strix]|uniref:Putative Multidrug resistance-associated protein n=1 Tax=Streblomastix strix TaxID=222440 RepID=A0A5J4VLJ4_9EUKA|nr:MAG: putative Multidrug resistance-associated protein [Streblomastix strix]